MRIQNKHISKILGAIESNILKNIEDKISKILLMVAVCVKAWVTRGLPEGAGVPWVQAWTHQRTKSREDW